MKRMFDLLVGGAALLALLPLVLLIALSVRLFIGRPIFFRQQRPGLHGRPFQLIKFRTMRTGLPGESDEARLGRFGRLLRASSLDELPELWNIIRGDMSLVGPRPLLMQYLPRYTARQARRHEVRPGLTGWAQINGRNALGWDEKFELDVWYVDNRSLLLDFKIILVTALSLVRPRGISAEGSATMPEFMGSEAVEPSAKAE